MVSWLWSFYYIIGPYLRHFQLNLSDDWPLISPCIYLGAWLTNQKLVQTTRTNIALQRHTTSSNLSIGDADTVYAPKFGLWRVSSAENSCTWEMSTILWMSTKNDHCKFSFLRSDFLVLRSENTFVYKYEIAIQRSINSNESSMNSVIMGRLHVIQYCTWLCIWGCMMILSTFRPSLIKLILMTFDILPELGVVHHG